MVLLLSLLALISVLCTLPIQDGDLFWHMAYAKQMLQGKTLILDHTQFSWTPSSNRTIYCAWISQLFFYWIWEHLGMWSIFALRYLCVIAAFLLLWTYVSRLKLLKHPVSWLALLLWALASSVGYQTKPELFSMLFFNILIFIYFHAKLLALDEKNPELWFYLVPCLFALWVNVHGGFILALPFLILTALGEGFALKFFPTLSFSRGVYVHLLLAWGLCFPLLGINPYGFKYPIQLFQDYALGQIARPDIAWNDAHISPFSFASGNYHFAFYFVLMVLVLGVLFYKSLKARRAIGGFEITLFLINLFYAALYSIYFRTTFYWPPIFTFSVFYLAHLLATQNDTRKQATFRSRLFEKAFALISLAIFIFLGSEAVWGQIVQPSYGSWFGFGISHANPVEEAKFLKSRELGPRMYNIFDSGGYLIWRLFPKYKVMTDSRSFPYLEWFDDQYRFSMGEDHEKFLQKYPADLAVIDLKNEGTWRNFLRDPNWRPVFYGPTAVIFVKKDKLGDLEFYQPSTERFLNLKNADTAFRVFRFAVATGDFKTAWMVLDHIEKKLLYQASHDELTIARKYRDAHKALRQHDYERATVLFASALGKMETSDRDRLIQTLLMAYQILRGQGKMVEAVRIERGLERLAAPL